MDETPVRNASGKRPALMVGILIATWVAIVYALFFFNLIANFLSGQKGV